MEAKRRALDEIAARQRAADQKREAEAERREQAAAASAPAPSSRSNCFRSDRLLDKGGAHPFEGQCIFMI
jgi:hypothetical protein